MYVSVSRVALSWQGKKQFLYIYMHNGLCFLQCFMTREVSVFLSSGGPRNMNILVPTQAHPRNMQSGTYTSSGTLDPWFAGCHDYMAQYTDITTTWMPEGVQVNTLASSRPLGEQGSLMRLSDHGKRCSRCVLVCPPSPACFCPLRWSCRASARTSWIKLGAWCSTRSRDCIQHTFCLQALRLQSRQAVAQTGILQGYKTIYPL